MTTTINCEVNGIQREVEVSPGESLLEILRDRLGLVGTRRGCDTGGCGCCTVLVDGQAVYSCMTFGGTLDGTEVTTVEGLSTDGELDPLQEAFIETGAVQCGYCTSGMIMSAREFLDRRSSDEPPSETEVRKAVSGVLCRCTGYRKIVDAIQLASNLEKGKTNRD